MHFKSVFFAVLVLSSASVYASKPDVKEQAEGQFFIAVLPKQELIGDGKCHFFCIPTGQRDKKIAQENSDPVCASEQPEDIQKVITMATKEGSLICLNAKKCNNTTIACLSGLQPTDLYARVFWGTDKKNNPNGYDVKKAFTKKRASSWRLRMLAQTIVSGVSDPYGAMFAHGSQQSHPCLGGSPSCTFEIPLDGEKDPQQKEKMEKAIDYGTVQCSNGKCTRKSTVLKTVPHEKIMTRVLNLLD